MSTFVTDAAWALAAAFAISLAYQLYRATARAGVSRHDSMRVFLQGPVIYVVAAVVIVVLYEVTGRSLQG